MNDVCLSGVANLLVVKKKKRLSCLRNHHEKIKIKTTEILENQKEKKEILRVIVFFGSARHFLSLRVRQHTRTQERKINQRTNFLF